MIDIEKMSETEIGVLHNKIHTEMARRQNVMNAKVEKDEEDLLNSDRTKAIKERLVALEAELTNLPEQIDLNKTIVVKLYANNTEHFCVADMLDAGCENFLMASGVCEDMDSMSDEFQSIMANIEDNIDGEYIDVQDMVTGMESYQWRQFLDKLKQLEEDSQYLYDAGITASDLLADD